MTLAQPVATPVPLVSDGLLHTTCCVDLDLALCGKDVTGYAWDTPEPLCQRCEREVDNDYCPRFGECLAP